MLRKRGWLVAVSILFAISFTSSSAPAQARPQQPPGARARAGAPGQAGQRMELQLQRLESALASLGLSPEQNGRAQSIVEKAKSQLNDLRAKFQAGNITIDEVGPAAQQIMADTRQQLSGVLTPPQLGRLRDAMQNRANNPNQPASQPSSNSPANMMDEVLARDRSAVGAAPSPQAVEAPPPGPKIGENAPDLSLERLDGRNLPLAPLYKGKPLVIEFGSYSSPTFRQRVAGMEQLARQYGVRANFLIIYTKEAHPRGGWEVDRNKDEAVFVTPHTDLPARIAAAKNARQKLTITLPIAIDTMDDKAALAYGASENSAVVIGRDGTVLARQEWCDPFRLRTTLDDALAKPATQSSGRGGN